MEIPIGKDVTEAATHPKSVPRGGIIGRTSGQIAPEEPPGASTLPSCLPLSRTGLECTCMVQEGSPLAAAVENYLRARPRWIRWREWLTGRRYKLAHFLDRPRPLVIVAHAFRDAARARQMVRAMEQDWLTVPAQCREVYDEILRRVPGIFIIQLRRKNVCGCLGHRHLMVKEVPFAEPHDVFGGAQVGEMDIAYDRVESWLASPLIDTALDTQFMAGSRREEFHAQQLRLRLLSIVLHEAHHMAFSHEQEEVVRARSVAFYRDALANYVETARATLSLTIDRSFSRFGRD